MSLIDRLTGFFSRTAEDTWGESPEDVCVNCWGHQEYDQKYRELRHDRQIDVKNGEENRAFIRAFAVKYVDGIQLKRTPDGKRCDACGYGA
ncbi:MAG: hypothetical protein ACJAZO_003627 [Myxococcota bacterium]|jgi:hypothetical protein